MRSLKRQKGFIGVGAAILGAGALGLGGSYLSAREQRKAADNASGQQREMFEETRSDLAPYQQAGQLSLRELMTRLGLSGTPGTPGTAATGSFAGGNLNGMVNPNSTPGTPGTPGTMGGDPNNPNFGSLLHPFGLSDFQASPAYQFNLEQGKLALDKASASRGKFYAPSTLQDIAKYSQGVASNEFQNAYSNYTNNMQNIFNRLYSVSGSGQNAAAQTGAFGTNAATQIGQNTIGAGNANAAGIVGGTNAITGAASNYANYNLLQQYLAGNQQGSTGGNVGMGLGGQAGVL